MLDRTSVSSLGRLFAGLLLAVAAASSLQAAEPAAANPSSNEIRLLVRGDDLGSCHAVNTAAIAAYRDGILRSVEVMVPGPWFLEAAALLAENPGLDVGVHLTLTSEWDHLKWRPLTAAPSVTDADGYFYPNVGERGKPGSGLFGAPRFDEIERELRAQIEMARRHIKNVTHLTTHMFGPDSSPELFTVMEKLAREYGLPLELPGLEFIPSLGEWPKTTGEQKEAAMAAHLEHIGPGVWFFLAHPGTEDPEMRAMFVTPWYPCVASDRTGDVRVLTSARVREVIARRGIRLVSYAEILRERRVATTKP